MATSAGGGARSADGPATGPAALWNGSLALAAALLVAHVAVQFAPASVGLLDTVDRALDAAVPILVALVMAWAARHAGPSESRRAEAWWLLALAYLGFGAGEVASAVFNVGFDEGLASYVTGAVYLVFYPFFLAGVLRLPAAPLARPDRHKILLDTGIILLSAVLIAWTVTLKGLAARAGADPFRIGIATAYQVGDLMVLWALIELLLRRRDAATQSVYTLLAASAAFRIVTDLAWGRLILTGDATYKMLLDPGWTCSHLLAALAAVRSCAPSRPPGAPVRPPVGAPAARATLYLAYAGGVAAFALVVAQHLDQVTWVVAALAAGIVVLMGLRHALGLRENTRLYEELRVANDDLDGKVRERTAELDSANAVLQGRVRELILLSAVAEIAVEATTEDDLISRATLAIRGTLRFDCGGVLLADEAGGVLRPAPGFHAREDRGPLPSVAFGRGVAGSVAEAGVPRRVSDAAGEPGGALGDPEMRSELCVPLRTGDRVIGVVDVGSAEPDAFSADDERTLATVASQLATAMERLRDIEERKSAEEALRRSEERFRSMVQQSYDFVTVLTADGTITYESPSTSRILGYGAGALVGRSGLELIHPDDLVPVRGALERIAREGSSGVATEFRVRRSDGSWIYVEALGQNLLANPAVHGIVLTSREITERKRAEEEIRRKLSELTVLNAVAQVAGQAEDERSLIAHVTRFVRDALFPDDCGVLLVDEESGALRYTASYRQGVAGLNREPIPPGRGITGSVVTSGAARREGDLARVPEYLGRLPGMRSEVCVPIKVGQRVIGVLNAESGKPDAFTHHDEAVLGTIAGQLATAIGRLRARAAQRESEERFRRLADAAFEGIAITDRGRIVDANPRFAEMFGYQPSEFLGKDVMDFVAPESAAQVEGAVRQGKDELYEHLAVRKDGSEFPVETQGRPFPGGGTMRVAAVRDITERKRAEQRIQRQLERLAALRAIDSAITGGLDLSDTLALFLAHLVAQLHVDAADVLAFKPAANALVFAAGKGFRSDAIRRSNLLLGECFAGRAALERRTISVPDLGARAGAFTRAEVLEHEEFKIYFAAPLVAKGHVHGVLEVFARRSFEPDAEWLDYLDTMAGQLAIAIDNRTLFENLQRSNDELAQAYDRTLEGWSKALELRDRETHGHTARVVELTVRLASVMGVRSKDLVHVRRGALLHDIGKMAIPDNVLLKPGPLTAEEWEVMRRHSEFAFELLSPIGFLQPAIDIPYCHHERWDGSGYPRGLAGEAIPLAARIFAVVDTWDALRYDRPYRRAWSVEEVRAYVRGEAGTRFDPAVVDAFLRVVD